MAAEIRLPAMAELEAIAAQTAAMTDAQVAALQAALKVETVKRSPIRYLEDTYPVKDRETKKPTGETGHTVRIFAYPDDTAYSALSLSPGKAARLLQALQKDPKGLTSAVQSFVDKHPNGK